ncbi:uncharacterized protein LOC129806873 [Phlebotomus papatasi]|uniref:Uncharacterized protein n=1 Tax=Phlebotomus papatasi TaxID=29031 RepID=A0A1B0DKX0_PHLPP|nr:uncharacterized protein LOC129806873 [Phlebotomus papatasi]
MAKSPNNAKECTWLTFPGYCYDLMVSATDEALKRLRLKEVFNRMVQFSQEYPLLFVTTVAVILTTAFPITIFFLFVMCSVIFGFTGLVLIEGALITTGSLVICGFIGSLIVILLVTAASIIAGYYGLSQISNLF